MGNKRFLYNLQQQLEKIDIDNFKDYYKDHSTLDTSKKFSLSYHWTVKVAEYLDLVVHSVNDSNKLSVDKIKASKINNFGSLDEAYKQAHKKTEMTKFEKYGDVNYNNKDKCDETKLKRYGDRNYNNVEKSKQTKLDRYGDENYNNQEKRSKTCLDRYGDANYHGDHKLIYEKSCITKLERYGDKYYAGNRSNAYKKSIETKRVNKTFNTSSIEDQMLNKLYDIFGLNDVEHIYNKDQRYPFNCDFYIHSLDLFIELNAHWTHGSKPFNNSDDECIYKLKLWNEKAKISNFYKNAIRTWTERDVKKLEMAKANKLNYLMIYSKDELVDWVDTKFTTKEDFTQLLKDKEIIH